MTTAIATQLKSILDSQTKLIELQEADTYWQQKISQAVIADTSSIYLVFPNTVEELSKIVQKAAKNQWRVLICGNGSKLAWGKTARNIQLVISLQKCDRLIEHAIGDLTVTVEAGMKLADLQQELRSHNQFLPIDPSYPDTATLGGIVATADTGSWRQRYGGVRDLLLGISFVRADGAIAKAGGRVVKNVAGYDLMKLFTGAYGTLGIISQLTFRTYPLIPTSSTLVLTGKATNIAQATQTIRNSGLTPTVLDLLSAGVVNHLSLGNEIGLMLCWETISASIEQQQKQVTEIAKHLDLIIHHFPDQAGIELSHQGASLTTMPNSVNAVTSKIGLNSTAAINFLQLKPVIDLNVAVIIHVSSGVGTLQLEQVDNQAIREMRSHCEQNNGFLSILDASQSVKKELDVWGYRGNALKPMQMLKNQFDPQNILNCDRAFV